MRVWFLKETKSVCTSCATGCNIIIGSREEKIYRYEPRENDAVNACWMCDSGRLNYKWIGREDRLKDVLRARPEIRTWTAALNEISDKLKKAPARFGRHRRFGAPDERGTLAADKIGEQSLAR